MPEVGTYAYPFTIVGTAKSEAVNALLESQLYSALLHQRSCSDAAS